MKILIISRGVPSEKYPMLGIFEFDQAKALMEMGHDVVYATVDLRSIRRIRKFGPDSFTKEGVPVEALHIPCGRIGRYGVDFVRKRALNRIYKSVEEKHGKFDIIHTHFTGLGHAVASLYRDGEIPLIITEHYSGMNQEKIKPYLIKLGKDTYQHMDRVITVSDHLQKNIKKHFGVNSTVIGNMIDTKTFHYEGYKKKDTQFRFISIGTLTDLKRTGMLIEAFAKAFGEEDKVQLFIYGNGPEKNRLLSKLTQKKLTDRVHLMGLQERKIIASKMKECDAFVSASENETCGLAFLEAMATGLPVVANTYGGPEEFIDDAKGIIVPGGSMEALSEAMKTMKNNIQRYSRKDISRRISQEFSPEAIGKKLTKIYEEAIEEKNRNSSGSQ